MIYRVDGSHPAIVTEEQWALVQLEMERRGRLGSRFSSKGPMASRLVCSDCGGFYGSKVWHSTDRNRMVIWRCNNKYKDVLRASGGKKCCTRHVTEGEVMEAFSVVVARLLEHRPEVIAACEAVLAELMDTAAVEAKLVKAHGDAEALGNQVKALISVQAHDADDSFKETYAALEKRFQGIQNRIVALEAEKADREYRARQAEVFMATVRGMENLADANLFVALVDKVVVGEALRFVLKDGSEW